MHYNIHLAILSTFIPFILIPQVLQLLQTQVYFQFALYRYSFFVFRSKKHLNFYLSFSNFSPEKVSIVTNIFSEVIMETISSNETVYSKQNLLMKLKIFS